MVAQMVYARVAADLWSSLSLVAQGVLTSTLFAATAVLVADRSRLLRFVAAPPVLVLRYTPIAALVPVMILLLGVGRPLGVAVIFLGCAPSMALQFWDIRRCEPTIYYRFLRHAGLSRPKAYWYGCFLGSLPRYVRSLRVFAGWAWSYVILAELIGVGQGLGYAIQDARRWGDIRTALWLVVLVAAVGFLVDVAFAVVIRVGFAWERSYAGRHAYHQV